jgi:Putative zinc dependent peptidase (DUF5700)
MKYSSLLLFLLTSLTGVSQIKITYNIKAAQVILSALQKPTSRNAINNILQEPAVKSMIYHCSKFDPGVTDSSFVGTLYKVSNNKPVKSDPFRFVMAKTRIKEITSLLNYLTSKKDAINLETSKALNQYILKQLDFNIEVLVTVGGNSTGWTDNITPNNFGLDLVNLRGDEAGLRLVATHELYHMVQAKTFALKTYSSNPTINEILTETLLEGIAVVVADPAAANEGGLYIESEKRNFSRNMSILTTSFRLFDAVIFQAKNDPTHSKEELYNIGLSGMYNAPFYYIGFRVCSTVEEHLGRNKLVEMLETDMMSVYKEYIRIYTARPNSGLPKFSKETEEAILKYK